MKPQNPPAAFAGYCPFEIQADLSKLGLITRDCPSDFGLIRTYYKIENSDLPCHVFIHGVAADSTTWAPLLEAARASDVHPSNIILVDLPGFGFSQNLRNVMPIPDVGSAVLRAVHELGVKEVHLVGHSMGGFLALDMSARWAKPCDDRAFVISLVVFSGSYFGILNTIKRPVRNVATNPRTATLWNAYAMLCQTGRFGQAAVNRLTDLGLSRQIAAPFVAHPKELRLQVADTLMRQLNPRGVLQTAANGPTYDANYVWSKITVPLTAVFASEDQMVTEWDERELLACNPHAVTRWVRDAGHMMIVERPFESLYESGLLATLGRASH